MYSNYVFFPQVLKGCPRPQGQKIVALALASKRSGIGLGLALQNAGLKHIPVKYIPKFFGICL